MTIYPSCINTFTYSRGQCFQAHTEVFACRWQSRANGERIANPVRGVRRCFAAVKGHSSQDASVPDDSGLGLITPVPITMPGIAIYHDRSTLAIPFSGPGLDYAGEVAVQEMAARMGAVTARLTDLIRERSGSD